MMKTNPAIFDKNVSVVLRKQAGVSAILMFGGLALCFTGIGALLGVPMIIIGFFVKSQSRGAWKGNCPHCESEVAFAPDFQRPDEIVVSGFDCPICKGRIILKNQSFVAISGA